MLAPTLTPLIHRTAPKPVTPRVDAAGIANVIWNLHTILTAPDSTPAEARESKRRLLAVLDKIKEMRLLQMVVAHSPATRNALRAPRERPTIPTKSNYALVI